MGFTVDYRVSLILTGDNIKGEDALKKTLLLGLTLIAGFASFSVNAQSTSPNVTIIPVEKQVEAIKQATKKKCAKQDSGKACLEPELKQEKKEAPVKK
jgi:hypothetical protein